MPKPRIHGISATSRNNVSICSRFTAYNSQGTGPRLSSQRIWSLKGQIGDLLVDEESLVELAARLALHEQVLETLCAEHFEPRIPSAAAIDAFRQALIKRIHEAASEGGPAEEGTLAARITDVTTSQAEAFTERISLRVGSDVYRFR